MRLTNEVGLEEVGKIVKIYMSIQCCRAGRVLGVYALQPVRIRMEIELPKENSNELPGLCAYGGDVV